MNNEATNRAVQALIDFFEAGNNESDIAAKNVLDADFANKEYWREELLHLRMGTLWSGLRAPEAELLVLALHEVKKIFSDTE